MKGSFEISAALSQAQVNDLIMKLKAAVPFRPEYVAVTCGALGQQQIDSLPIVKMLVDHDYAVMPHLACVRFGKAEILDLLDRYQNLGVRHLLVVRGDMPLNPRDAKTDFSATTDLLDFIRQRYADHFKLGVAVNVNGQSQQSLVESITNLADKVDAGAEFAISQFFYNATLYQRFFEACVERNLLISIKPGLMPLSFKTLGFVQHAGVSVPPDWQKELQYAEETATLTDWNVEKLAELASAVLKMGAPGVHLFNLKEPEMLHKMLEKIIWPS